MKKKKKKKEEEGAEGAEGGAAAAPAAAAGAKAPAAKAPAAKAPAGGAKGGARSNAAFRRGLFLLFRRVVAEWIGDGRICGRGLFYGRFRQCWLGRGRWRDGTRLLLDG